MRTLGLYALVVGFLLMADCAQGQDVKKEADQLQGSWTMYAITRNGEEVPEEFLFTGKLLIKGDTYKVSLNEQGTTATFKLDGDKTPKQIDLTYTDGAQKGMTVKGIYVLDGETLKVCRGLTPETGRPTKFAAPTDSGLISAVWKRAKVVGDKKDVEAPAPTPSKPVAKPMPAAVAAELKRFEGTWVFESMVIQGQVISIAPFKSTKLVLQGNTFVMADANTTHKGTFEFDLAAKPKTIDLAFTDGPEAGKSIQAIYELTDDTYKVCLGLVPDKRPTEFASTPGSGLVLEVLRREKK